MCFSTLLSVFVSLVFGVLPEVQDGAAALVLVAVTLPVDFGGGVGRVTLRYGVEILQPLELVVTHLLSVNPERRNTCCCMNQANTFHTKKTSV